MRKFFIYSTPRSGSAWLANFLTYGGSFCQHEPLANGQMVWHHYPVSGAIDTGAAFVHYEPPPDVAVFHLWRDLAEVNWSLRRQGLPTYNMTDYRHGFDYRRMFDINYLEELWIEVTELPFDRPRAEMLIEMNVQRNMDALAKRVRRA